MPTNLPLPTADSIKTYDGVPQYGYIPELRTELRALVSDIPKLAAKDDDLPEHLRDMDPDQRRQHAVQVSVGVYTPDAARANIFLGYYSPKDATTAFQRIVSHLPGCHYCDNAAWVQWGSREPGWTPTAIWVMRPFTGFWREPDTILSSDDVAERLGIQRKTWRAYVARGNANAPKPIGDADIDGRRRPVWDADDIQRFQDNRPGQGVRRETPS